jgi:Na+/proline symporter
MNPLTAACSDQIAIQRFLSTRNWKEGFKSQIVATCSAFPFVLTLWFVGLALFTYYSQNPDPSLNDSDGVFFRFIATHLPTPMPGIFMAAMLAAIMSTLDSGINSMATIWLKEFHQKYINKKMDGIQEVKTSRWATLSVGIIAIGLGLLLDGSGKWLAQSAAEIGVLFYLFNSIILPAFLFAVLSPRANSRLIWLLMFYSIGSGVAMKIWYALSRATKQAWNPGEPLSWAGPISFMYVLTPLIIGIFFIVLWFVFKSKRKLKLLVSSLMVGALGLGVTQGMLVWYIFSNALIDKSPMARSFMFYLPLNLIIGFIALQCCPRQPREKYQGLTLGTINEPILTKMDN